MADFTRIVARPQKGVNIVEYDKQFLEPLLQETLSKYKYEPFSDSLMVMAKQGRVKLNDIRVNAIDTSESFDEIPNQL